MKNIQQPVNILPLLLGEQKISNNCNLRLMNYVIKIEHNGHILLWNNLTKELIELTESEAKRLEVKPLIADNEFLITLAKKWFLVPLNYDEFKLSQQIYNLAKNFNIDNTINQYTILPTTACNARCFYCFEAGTKFISMDKQIANDTADFIIKNSNNKKVHISWFGGEPLCNTGAIDIITSKLRENGVKFNSSIVTNGYLFNKENVKKALERWNIINVQITLDGTEKIYNSVKNYIYEKINAFAVVMTNIGLLLENGIRVSIRLNLDKYNKEDLTELINLLNLRFGKYDNFTVYARLLYENEGYEKVSRTSEEQQYMGKELSKMLDLIKSYSMSTKQRNADTTIKIYACMADNPNSIMVLPDGKLGRCEHFVSKDFCGDIYNGITKGPWSRYIPKAEKCKTCVYCPSCLVLEGCSDHSSECREYEKKIRIDKMIAKVKNTFDKTL